MWQKVGGSWWDSTGKPLMLSGGHGEGVSAGDEGRLLYTQHANGDERAGEEEHKHFHSGK